MKNKLKVDFSSKYQTKVVLHSLVWLMFFLLHFYNMGFGTNRYNMGFLVLIFTSMLIFYFNYSFLVPKYMMSKNWKMYFLFLSLLFLIHCLIFLNIEPFAPKPNIHIDFNGKIPDFKVPPPSFKLFPAILLFIFMTAVGSFFKIYEIWNQNMKRKKEIESENRITELNFLKAQLNPHFFFNSLNTIYSLSISKSPKTSDAILNLSELMRYMLSDKKEIGSEQKVKLTEEIEYINNYIALQKLRITPNNEVIFTIEGNIEKIEVFPLLFISFIENAFKFGIHPVDKSFITITFKVENNSLEFTLKNQIHFQKKSYDSFGLGNQNSTRRINLYYPENKLQIDAENNCYTVFLKINFNEN